MVNSTAYTAYTLLNCFLIGHKAVLLTLNPAKVLTIISPKPNHQATFLEIYFARFLGIALWPLLLYVISARTLGTSTPTSTLLLTTLLNAGGAAHVYDTYTKTKHQPFFMDAALSAVGVVFGVALLLLG